MMIGPLAFVAFIASQSALSEQAAALVAPVHAAYVQAAVVEASLPAPVSTRERLERMYDIDQAGRAAFETIDFSKLSESQRKAATAVAWSEINAHDAADQAALRNMMPKTGWFLPSVYGKKASDSAFLIVQHAIDDQALMRDVLARLKPLAEKGDVDGGQYALMYDRIALEFDHKPQRYGSQVSCEGGRWAPRSLEKPATVDARRRQVGLREDEASYLSHFKDLPCS